MKANSNSNIINLTKFNLKVSNLYIKISLSSILFSIIIYKILERLNTFSVYNKIYVNYWDGVFRVLSFPMLFLAVYYPLIMIFSVLTDNMGAEYNRLIMIRSKDKIKWVVSKILSNLIISFAYTLAFFLITLIISKIFFGFQNEWSYTIKNINNMKLVTQLYVNSFVFELTPIEACIISFIQVYLCTAIVINLRDVLINYIEKTYIANLISCAYLFLNIISDGYSLNKGIFMLFNYIALDTMGLLWQHKFENFNYFNTTLLQSIIISLLFLTILIGINLKMNKKLVIKND